jgi:hypothetical protein
VAQVDDDLLQVAHPAARVADHELDPPTPGGRRLEFVVEVAVDRDVGFQALPSVAQEALGDVMSDCRVRLDPRLKIVRAADSLAPTLKECVLACKLLSQDPWRLRSAR